MATSSLPKELGRSCPGEGASKSISRDKGGYPLHPHLRVQIDASSFPGPIAGFRFLDMNSKKGLYA